MTKNKKIIIISTVTAFVVLMGVLVALFVLNNGKNSKKSTSQEEIGTDKAVESLTKVEKEIAGIDTSDDDEELKEENYSALYKEYLKLSKEEQEKAQVIPRKEDVPFEKLDDIKRDEDLEDDGTIPEKFNLADKIDIQVENQGIYGLCWDFASIKPLETYLALNKLGNYDFSELHVDYITSDLLYGTREIHQGGNFNMFKDYLIESGVVLEETVPYCSTSTNSYGTIRKYNDFKEDVYNTFIDMDSVVEVTETVDFPSFYKNEDINYTEDDIAEFRETVKKHIMKNGGLYCCIATPDYGTKYYNSSTFSECFLGDWNDLSSGREFHAVTVIGWDDNYSKDNFKEGMKPQHDGAYILLNSWGEDWGNNGIFYISYEDKYIETDLSGIISTSMDSAYKISSIKSKFIQEYLTNNYKHLFINYNGEDYITKNVLSKIYTLDFSDNNISSIDGIEIFSNVYSLDLSNNNLTDISPLTKLNSLTSLDLSNNNLTDISVLGNMKRKSFYTLNLSNNKISDVSALTTLIVDAEYAPLSLDISGNLNVKGFENIPTISDLNISDCNINDVSILKGNNTLSSLNISNTPGIIGLDELPENIHYLNISNCNLNTLSGINTNIYSLNISKNNLTTLDGIQTFEALCNLDISENPIIDWSALKEVTIEDPIQIEDDYDDYYDEYYDGYGGDSYISISADNCNIKDITVFNDIDCISSLSLKNNTIIDVSQFNSNNIYYIDLSNNKNITGLDGLKNIGNIFLDDCNISDVSEILKLDNVYNLSLENNNLVDISELSNLNNLYSLSLEGNKGLTGTLSNENLNTLNLSDCNLDDTFDFSKLPKLSNLNISQNPHITDFEKIFNTALNNFLNIYLTNTELNYDKYEQINQLESSNNNYYYINMYYSTINLTYKLQDNKEIINLNQYNLLKRALMQNITKNTFIIKNGYINKNGYIINVDDSTKDFVEIEFKNWDPRFQYSTIKINIHPTEESVDTNNTDSNTIDEMNENDDTIIDEDINDNPVDEENNNNSNTINSDNTIDDNQENTVVNED